MAGRLLLGIDLGPSVIRIAEASRAGSSIAVARWAELTMPPDAYRDGHVLDPQAVGKALKEGLKAHFRPSTRQVALAVGGQAALVRRTVLPKLKLGKVRELLETQGDSWIPFLREGAAYEVAVINPSLNERNQEVLIVAVPSRLITGFSAALKVAGLKLAAVEVDTLALFRTAQARASVPAEGVVAVLQVEPAYVRLGLMENGMLVSVKNLDTRVRVNDGAPDVTEAFLADFRRSLELMMARMTETKPLTSLVLSSSLLTPETLLGPLERELQGSISGQLGDGFAAKLMTDTRAPQGSDLALGLSLVLAGAPKAMRLLPKPTVREQKQQRLSLVCSLLLLGAAAGYTHFWQQEAPRLKAQQTKLDQTLVQLRNELLREKEVAAEEALIKRLAPLEEQLAKHDRLSVSMPDLKQLLPEGLTITSLTSTPPHLTLVGSASSPELVSTFLQALADSAAFGSPVLKTSDAGTGPANFTIEVEMAPRR